MNVHYVLVLSTAALIGCGPAASETPANTPLSRAGRPIVSAIGGKCLDDAGDSTANFNKVQLYTCLKNDAQSWAYTDGTFVGAGGKCLDIKGDVQVPGTVVDLYRCLGNAGQKWTVNGTSIVSTQGLCLDAKDGVNENGTQIELATCDGSNSQVWHVGGETTPVTPLPPATPPSVNADAGTSNTTQKPITQWARCDGTDQYTQVAAAFAAAAHNAFELTVDCPVTIDIGTVSGSNMRSIFIDSDTTVSFLPGGKFIVNNVWQPAFAIMNASNVTLNDWNVLYTGSTPVESGGAVWTYHGWNDIFATQWLAAHRGVVFDNGATAQFSATTNESAILTMAGPSNNINVNGFTATASSVTDATKFIACVFSFGTNWNSNQTVSSNTATAANTSGVSNVSFRNVSLDGVIMGFVGGGINGGTFENITEYHYGDVQDAAGNIGKSYPPPHLFYLTHGGPQNLNSNLHFTNIVDGPDAGSPGGPLSVSNNGWRVGAARDNPTAWFAGAGTAAAGSRTLVVSHANAALLIGEGVSDAAGHIPKKCTYDGIANLIYNTIVAIDGNTVTLTCATNAAVATDDSLLFSDISGVLYSFKLGCTGCSVDGYTSNRPDGFMEIYGLSDVTLSNITARYNSQFTWGIFVGGIAAAGPATSVTFDNVTLTDVAATPRMRPIDNGSGSFTNTNVYMSDSVFVPYLNPYDNNEPTCDILEGCTQTPSLPGVVIHG